MKVAPDNTALLERGDTVYVPWECLTSHVKKVAVKYDGGKNADLAAAQVVGMTADLKKVVLSVFNQPPYDDKTAKFEVDPRKCRTEGPPELLAAGPKKQVMWRAKYRPVEGLDCATFRVRLLRDVVDAPLGVPVVCKAEEVDAVRHIDLGISFYTFWVPRILAYMMVDDRSVEVVKEMSCG